MLDFVKIISPNLNKLIKNSVKLYINDKFVSDGIWMARKDLLTEVEIAKIKEKLFAHINNIKEEQINKMVEQIKAGEEVELDGNVIYLHNSFSPTLRLKNYEDFEFNAWDVGFYLNKLRKDKRFQNGWKLVLNKTDPVFLAFVDSSDIKDVTEDDILCVFVNVK